MDDLDFFEPIYNRDAIPEAAFPVLDPNGSFYNPGMTLRDYFASKVMQAMITGIDTDEKFLRYRNIAKEKGMNVSEWIASDAYKQADAMMKFRSQQP